VEEDGYVSSNACRACHPAQYEAWHASFHRTTTQVATPDSVRADFDGTRVDAVAGNPIVLERRGSEYFAEFGDPDWRGVGDTRPPITRQIVMVTGSQCDRFRESAIKTRARANVKGQAPAMRRRRSDPCGDCARVRPLDQPARLSHCPISGV
jgi:hypothetical protein